MKVIDVLLIRLPWFEQYGSPLIIHVYKIDKEKKHFNWPSIIWVFILFQPNGSREYTHMHVCAHYIFTMAEFSFKGFIDFFINYACWPGTIISRALELGDFLRFRIIDPLDQLDLTWRVMDGFSKSSLTIRGYQIFVKVSSCFFFKSP